MSGTEKKKKEEENKDEEKKDLTPKRFLNGWSKEQEKLMAEWSDIALSYHWLHDKSGKLFHSKALWINLPVIILTTLGGTANFGVQSIFNTDEAKQYASFVIGFISLGAGILTTIGNYLRYAQLEEAHRVASISWGKFQRLLSIELALHPDDRMDASDFLKICRAELDRLIEQSPPIPSDPVIEYNNLVDGENKGYESDNKNNLSDHKIHKNKLKKPEICGNLAHTRVFKINNERLQHSLDEAKLLENTLKDKIKEEVIIEIKEVLERSKSPKEMEKVDEKIKNKIKYEERLQFSKYQYPISPRKPEENGLKRASTMNVKSPLLKDQVNNNPLFNKQINEIIIPDKLGNEIENSEESVEEVRLEVEDVVRVNDENDGKEQKEDVGIESNKSPSKRKNWRDIYEKKIEK
jgi:hypothetical protein